MIFFAEGKETMQNCVSKDKLNQQLAAISMPF